MNMKTSGIRTHLRKTIASLRWVSHVQGVYGDLTKHRRLDAGDKSHEYYNNLWSYRDLPLTSSSASSLWKPRQ
jgi:hypothetical protein